MNRLIFAVLLAFLFLQVSPLFSEEDYAILHTSPQLKKGIPALGPNAVENYFALYRYQDTEFEVSYTEKRILISKDWKEIICSYEKKSQKLYRIPSKEYFEALYFDTRGYFLIFTLPVDWPYSCSFIVNFIADFNFFLAFRRYETDIPFPAVVRLK